MVSSWKICGRYKQKTRNFFILSILLKGLLGMWITSIVKEKVKNVKNPVYVVSIFIFSDGWLHISES